mmetsp:Transcript_19268/g.62416  ORF Transcript_19268/g.62416 Transcript_19268/m.62416 type:complete len:320 (+) Transcript_19268:230-1189(+)
MTSMTGLWSPAWAQATAVFACSSLVRVAAERGRVRRRGPARRLERRGDVRLFHVRLRRGAAAEEAVHELRVLDHAQRLGRHHERREAVRVVREVVRRARRDELVGDLRVAVLQRHEEHGPARAVLGLLVQGRVARRRHQTRQHQLRAREGERGLEGALARLLQDPCHRVRRLLTHQHADRRLREHRDVLDRRRAAVQRRQRRGDGDLLDLVGLAPLLEQIRQRGHRVQRRAGLGLAALGHLHEPRELVELDLARLVRVQELDQRRDLLLRGGQADVLEERLDLPLVDGARAVGVDLVERGLRVGRLAFVEGQHLGADLA